MFILELTRPGSFLNFADPDRSHELSTLLNFMESAFFEANVALNLFNLSYNTGVKDLENLIANQQTMLQRDIEQQKREEVEDQIRKELGLQPYEEYATVQYEVDIRLKKEEWSKGIIPSIHKNSLNFIYAKSFLSALDTFGKFLKVLSEEPDSSPRIKDIYGRMRQEIPDLVGVRNSTQHLEDRARGLGAPQGRKETKALQLQPINKGGIQASRGALGLGNLNGTKFGSTKANGEYGEVDISLDTLIIVQNLMQEVFDSFQWYGPKQHLPY